MWGKNILHKWKIKEQTLTDYEPNFVFLWNIKYEEA